MIRSYPGIGRHGGDVSSIQIVKATVFSAALGLLLLLTGCHVSVRNYSIVSVSMLPLLRPGDRVFADESSDARTNLHDGDVIVFRHNDVILIKRILAMPGETVIGNHRKVFRDGKQLDEPYLAIPTGEEVEGLATFPPQKIPAGEIFVMGDNRDISLDSRTAGYGPVRLTDVRGKYMYTYWHGSAPAK